MVIEDQDMIGERAAMVAPQQRRDAVAQTTSLAPWEQHEDDKRTFTDFLEDAKRSREQQFKTGKPVASGTSMTSGADIVSTSGLAPLMVPPLR
jgi:hypothetical protein